MQRAGKKKKPNKQAQTEKLETKARKQAVDDTLQLVLGVSMAILLDHPFNWDKDLSKLDAYVTKFNKAFEYMLDSNVSKEWIYNYVKEKSDYDLKNL